MREKLIELIQSAVDGCATYWAGLIADHLIANGVTVQKWISVSERLPEDIYERVLVKVDFCNILVGNPKIDTDRYDLGMWVRYGSHVTHWMPLPQPPKGE